MSQQTYPVACECGKVHQCPAGYAGTKFACPCGKAVEVPALSVLRRSVGEAVLSPELEIQALMSQQALPEESDCCLCRCQTTDSLMLLATCETVSVDPPVTSWLSALSLVLFLITGIAIIAGGGQRAIGRDIQVQFPLRMCQPCAAEVSSWDVIRAAMRRTPVYRRLLRKYPECQLSTVKGV